MLGVWLATALPLIGCVAATLYSQVTLGQVELAKYSGTGTGGSGSVSQTLPQPAAPTPLVSGHNVTVSWAATTMSGGTPVPAYVVQRYTATGTPATTLAGCNGNVTSTSCVENGVPDGQWRYSIHAVAGNWSGDESGMSATVTVATPTLVFTSPTINTLPAALTGTIANFVGGGSLTFHLDSASGPSLTGSPSTVPPSGSASISVTIPVGTNDAPHSVYAVGSSGSVAAAAINIVDPPHLVSLTMWDTNTNGRIDQVIATFDDTLATYTAGVAPWTLTNVPSGGTLQSVAVSGATATLTIAEGTGAASTAAGSFTVSLAANSAGIRDVYNHTSSFAATAVTDKAPPGPASMSMQDTNHNGKVDHVVITFSEALPAYTAGNTPWTLANVPSGGSLKSVAVASPTVTLTLNEGAGAVDTSVGSFTIALATSGTGIRDAAGNLTSWTARAPSDGAAPIRTGMDMLDANHDGYVDSTAVTFSEALATTYTPSTTPWTLTNVPSTGTLTSVSVSGAVATLHITQGAGAASTDPGNYRVALAANAAGVRDAAGNQASFTATKPTDKAPPAPLSMVLDDSDNNGKVDTVAITFSETLANYSAGNAPWTLANVPSGGTLDTVTQTKATITLALNEGAGAVDTSAGSMTIALASNANGVRDAAGNLTSFSATQPTDGATPLVTSITDTGGATNGRIEPGDSLIVTYSEPLKPSTIPASTTVTYTDPNGGGNDTLTITGITQGARATGSQNYITLNNSSAGFASSTVALSNGNKTITVTVGPTCAGNGCAALGTLLTMPNLSWLTATSITDVAGNAPTVTFTTAIRLF